MKYVLFTGATGDLGEECVKAISQHGDYTVFAAGTNEIKLKGLGEYPNVIPVKLDVTSEESIDRAYELIRTYTYRLYAVINFAGIHSFTSMVEGECVEDMEKMLNVNVMGMIRVNKRFFEMVRIGRGRIINCSSESGWMTPQPFNGPYTITKYAVEAYNDSLRRELMYLDIPVIKLQPGSFKTRLTRQIFEDFDKVTAATNYYKKLLTTMKPLMTMELGLDHDPQKLVNKVMRALNSKRPQIKYKTCTGKLLLTLEFLPDKVVDLAYKALV